MKIILIIAVAFVALQAYVRLLPIVVSRWHVDPFTAADPGRTGGRLYLAGDELRYADGAQALEAARSEMLSMARTKVVAGSVEEGRITFITRSALWGFPDFTTIGTRDVDGGYEIGMFARLRFGRADLGVNMKRIKQIAGVLSAAQ